MADASDRGARVTRDVNDDAAQIVVTTAADSAAAAPTNAMTTRGTATAAAATGAEAAEAGAGSGAGAGAGAPQADSSDVVGGSGAHEGSEASRTTKKPDCYLLIHNVAKRHNVGNIVRSACAFGVKEVLVVGSRDITGFGAQGTMKHMQFSRHRSLAAAARCVQCLL